MEEQKPKSVLCNPLFFRLHLPEGIEDLLEGLAREILRHRPRNIHLFAAHYFQYLVTLRDKGMGCVSSLCDHTSYDVMEGMTSTHLQQELTPNKLPVTTDIYYEYDADTLSELPIRDVLKRGKFIPVDLSEYDRPLPRFQDELIIEECVTPITRQHTPVKLLNHESVLHETSEALTTDRKGEENLDQLQETASVFVTSPLEVNQKLENNEENEVITISKKESTDNTSVDVETAEEKTPVSQNEMQETMVIRDLNDIKIPRDIKEDQSESLSVNEMLTTAKQSKSTLDENMQELAKLSEKLDNLSTVEINDGAENIEKSTDSEENIEQINKEQVSEEFLQELMEGDSAELENAATRLQANFRGFQTRKSFSSELKSTEQSTTINTEATGSVDIKTDEKLDEKVVSNLKVESQLESMTLENDDTVLQKTNTSVENGLTSLQTDQQSSEVSQEFLQELMEGDPEELENAAMKLQASFRGFQTRKELTGNSLSTGETVSQSGENEKADTKPIESELVQESQAVVLGPGLYGDQNADQELNAQQASEVSQEFLQELTEGDPEELEKAATKLQANFRGFQTRKQITSEASSTEENVFPSDDKKNNVTEVVVIDEIVQEPQTETTQVDLSPDQQSADTQQASEVSQEFLQELTEGDPEELEKAATKLQANFRGFQTRKQITSETSSTEENVLLPDDKKNNVTEVVVIDEVIQESQTETTQVDLSPDQQSADTQQASEVSQEFLQELAEGDPEELEKAATKLQANFRGFQTRKQITSETSTTEENVLLPDDKKNNVTEVVVIDEVIQESQVEPIQTESLSEQQNAEKASEVTLEASEVSQEFLQELTEGDPEELEKAATKLQANFRGFQTRKQITSEASSTEESVLPSDNKENKVIEVVVIDDIVQESQTETKQADLSLEQENADTQQASEVSQEFLQELTEGDPEELEKAATKLQANFRGFQTRKQMTSELSTTDENVLPSDNKENNVTEVVVIDEIVQESQIGTNQAVLSLEQENADTQQASEVSQEFLQELTEGEPEELEKAATKLQANFRGFQTRKQITSEASPAEENVLPPNDKKNDVIEGAMIDEAIQESQVEPIQTESLSEQQNAKKASEDTQEASEVSQEFLQELTEGDPEEMEKAATKLQANFRGFKTRKQITSELSSTDETVLSPSDVNESENITVINEFVQESQVEVMLSAPSGDQNVDTALEESQQESEVSTEFLQELMEGDPEELEKAATKLQANFRGFQTRKQITSESPLTEENVFPSDDKKYNVATVVQESQVESGQTEFASKQLNAGTAVDDTQQESEVSQEFLQELTEGDPEELEKAATKLQASFRGFQTRKQITSESSSIEDTVLPSELDKKNEVEGIVMNNFVEESQDKVDETVKDESSSLQENVASEPSAVVTDEQQQSEVSKEISQVSIEANSEESENPVELLEPSTGVSQKEIPGEGFESQDNEIRDAVGITNESELKLLLGNSMEIEQNLDQKSDKDKLSVEEEVSKEFLEELMEGDPEELEKAASKLQASFRGFQTRKELQLTTKSDLDTISEPQSRTLDSLAEESEKIENAVVGKDNANQISHDDAKEIVSDEFLEELMEEDPEELQKAATKLQANFRGFQTRKQIQKVASSNEEFVDDSNVVNEIEQPSNIELEDIRNMLDDTMESINKADQEQAKQLQTFTLSDEPLTNDSNVTDSELKHIPTEESNSFNDIANNDEESKFDSNLQNNIPQTGDEVPVVDNNNNNNEIVNTSELQTDEVTTDSVNAEQLSEVDNTINQIFKNRDVTSENEQGKVDEKEGVDDTQIEKVSEEFLKELMEGDPAELENAAMKLQSSFRGFQQRKVSTEKTSTGTENITNEETENLTTKENENVTSEDNKNVTNEDIVNVTNEDVKNVVNEKTDNNEAIQTVSSNTESIDEKEEIGISETAEPEAENVTEKPKNGQSSQDDKVSEEFLEELLEGDPEELAEAATKLQAKFRGFQARKNLNELKVTGSQTSVEDEKPENGDIMLSVEINSKQTGNDDESQEGNMEIDKDLGKIDSVVLNEENSPNNLNTNSVIECECQGDCEGRCNKIKEQPKNGSVDDDIANVVDEAEVKRRGSLIICECGLEMENDKTHKCLRNKLTANQTQSSLFVLPNTDNMTSAQVNPIGDGNTTGLELMQQENSLNEFLQELSESNPEDLEKAATKLQANFRGFQTRKKLGDEIPNEETASNEQVNKASPTSSKQSDVPSLPLKEISNQEILNEEINNEDVLNENLKDIKTESRTKLVNNEIVNAVDEVKSEGGIIGNTKSDETFLDMNTTTSEKQINVNDDSNITVNNMNDQIIVDSNITEEEFVQNGEADVNSTNTQINESAIEETELPTSVVNELESNNAGDDLNKVNPTENDTANDITKEVEMKVISEELQIDRQEINFTKDADAIKKNTEMSELLTDNDNTQVLSSQTNLEKVDNFGVNVENNQQTTEIVQDIMCFLIDNVVNETFENQSLLDNDKYNGSNDVDSVILSSDANQVKSNSTDATKEVENNIEPLILKDNEETAANNVLSGMIENVAFKFDNSTVQEQFNDAKKEDNLGSNATEFDETINTTSKDEKSFENLKNETDSVVDSVVSESNNSDEAPQKIVKSGEAEETEEPLTNVNEPEAATTESQVATTDVDESQGSATKVVEFEEDVTKAAEPEEAAIEVDEPQEIPTETNESADDVAKTDEFESPRAEIGESKETKQLLDNTQISAVSDSSMNGNTMNLMMTAEMDKMTNESVSLDKVDKDDPNTSQTAADEIISIMQDDTNNKIEKSNEVVADVTLISGVQSVAQDILNSMIDNVALNLATVNGAEGKNLERDSVMVNDKQPVNTIEVINIHDNEKLDTINEISRADLDEIEEIAKDALGSIMNDVKAHFDQLSQVNDVIVNDELKTNEILQINETNDITVKNPVRRMLKTETFDVIDNDKHDNTAETDYKNDELHINNVISEETENGVNDAGVVVAAKDTLSNIDSVFEVTDTDNATAVQLSDKQTANENSEVSSSAQVVNNINNVPVVDGGTQDMRNTNENEIEVKQSEVEKSEISDVNVMSTLVETFEQDEKDKPDNEQIESNEENLLDIDFKERYMIALQLEEVPINNDASKKEEVHQPRSEEIRAGSPDSLEVFTPRQDAVYTPDSISDSLLLESSLLHATVDHAYRTQMLTPDSLASLDVDVDGDSLENSRSPSLAPIQIIETKASVSDTGCSCECIYVNDASKSVVTVTTVNCDNNTDDLSKMNGSHLKRCNSPNSLSVHSESHLNHDVKSSKSRTLSETTNIHQKIKLLRTLLHPKFVMPLMPNSITE